MGVGLLSEIYTKARITDLKKDKFYLQDDGKQRPYPILHQKDAEP